MRIPQTLTNTLTALLLCASAIVTGTATAAETRQPLAPSRSNTTVVPYRRYHEATEIVRERSTGKSFASFHANPQLLERGMVATFQIRSEAETGAIDRWRCVAVRDVAECLGAPVKLRYLPDDSRMVLTVTVVPKRNIPRRAVAVAQLDQTRRR